VRRFREHEERRGVLSEELGELKRIRSRSHRRRSRQDKKSKIIRTGKVDGVPQNICSSINGKAEEGRLTIDRDL